MADETLKTEKYKKKREANRRYYEKTSWIYPRHFWTEEEEKMVLAHTVPDSELSDKLGRSIKSIQEKRRRMRRDSEAQTAAQSN